MTENIEFSVDDYHFKSHSVFENLPVEDKDFLKAAIIPKKYKKGDMLFLEGSYPAGIFYLIEGKVKKFKVDNDGREHIIYICNKGELLGYPALLSEETFSDSAAAIENSTVGFIPKKAFITLLEKSPVLSRKLLKNLSHEFAVLENNILSMAHKTVRERLALTLLILRDKFKTEGENNDPIEINLSREDLANILGTAVETLVRFLREFKDEKIIQTKGRTIFILNAKRLVEIANIH
ncbi:MAG: Crp/Fnr family transcriptional regulator [Gillisia sp.]